MFYEKNMDENVRHEINNAANTDKYNGKIDINLCGDTAESTLPGQVAENFCKLHKNYKINFQRIFMVPGKMA